MLRWRVKYLLWFNNDVFNDKLSLNEYYGKLYTDFLQNTNDKSLLQKYLSRSPIEEAIWFKEVFNRNKISNDIFRWKI